MRSRGGQTVDNPAAVGAQLDAAAGVALPEPAEPDFSAGADGFVAVEEASEDDDFSAEDEDLSAEADEDSPPAELFWESRLSVR